MFTGLKLILQLIGLTLGQSSNELDPAHPLMRMQSARYRDKKKVVRGLWIATGVLMLAFPLSHFIVTLGLFTTFLSFTILDEAR